MKLRFVQRAAVLAFAAVSAGCGTDFNAPENPAVPSPFVAQIGGQWTGSTQLIGVTAATNNSPSECAQPTLQSTVNAVDPVNLAVTQSDQQLVARVTSGSSGLSCSYAGSASLNTISLDLADAAACHAPLLVLRCAGDDPPVYDMKLVGSSVLGTVSGGVLQGTISNTYNVFETSSSVGVTRVTLNYNYNARKQ